MTTAEQRDRRSNGDAGHPAVEQAAVEQAVERPSDGRLAGFDGVRAVAALSLLVYHSVLFSYGFTGTRPWELTIQLRSGVWIFFVLSGFLLYRPFVAAHAGTRPSPAVGRYAWSRFLRIYPAYAVALVGLTYVVHETFLQAYDRFLVQAGLLQIYNLKVLRRSFPLDITWSLATEVSFYVFLPFFAFAVARLARRTGALRAELAGLASMLVVGWAWQILMHGHALKATWLPSFFPVFAVGMGLAVAITHLPETAAARLRSFARKGTLCWALAFGVLVVKALTVPIDLGFQDGHAFGPQLLYTTFALLMVLPLVFGQGSTSLVHRFVGTRVMVFLGTISYGIFLWNQAVIHWINFTWFDLGGDQRGSAWKVIAIALPATIAIATASWYLVERPVLRLKGRIRRS